MSTSKEFENGTFEKPNTYKEEYIDMDLRTLREMAEQHVKSNRTQLTDLYNYKAFIYLNDEMMRQNPNAKAAVILMDISNFKAVNEFSGRNEGNRMLIFFADLFRHFEQTRPHTCISHVRADNFCLGTIYQDEQELIDIVMYMKQKIYDYPLPYRVLPAFGICTNKGGAMQTTYMKDCAAIAANLIKGKFYASYLFYHEDMRLQLMREKEIENDFMNALENQGLCLYVQPKVDMETGRIVGGEALMRLSHPQKGMLFPADFIPILERSGLIIETDAYIWEKVFAYLAGLKQSGRPLIPISINVSRVHVHDDAFCERLIGLSEKYQIDPKYVPLEITEGSFRANETVMRKNVDFLQAKGFTISMDDFGSGYSTLNMLKDWDMDEIKLDKELISGIEYVKAQIVNSHLIDLLKALKVKILIEGVETQAQKRFLLDCGCKYVQGFLFYKPMPVEEFDRLLLQETDGLNLE